METAERRILVASYHAPPAPQVGGLRWWGLSKHLARRGWRIHLMTSDEGADLQDVPPGMTVEVVPAARTLNDRYREWKRARASSNGPEPRRSESGAGPDAPGRSSAASGRGDPFRTLRRGLGSFTSEIGALLSFPDEGRGWILPLSRALRNRVRDFHPDLVVSSGPPHSVHLGAGLGLRGSAVPWITDFRDPWVDVTRVHLDVSWAAPFFGRLEADVVQGSRRVVTTTPELAAIFEARYPGTPVHFLPNGVDAETLPPRAGSGGSGLQACHLGSLYIKRDPIPVLRAFARFLRRNPEAREEGSGLRFIGKVNDHFIDPIHEVAAEEGISDHVHLPGMRPREEALRTLAETGVAIVLAQQQKSAIPAKIYESAAMSVPTLVVTEADSATAGAAARLGAAVHAPDDIEGMAQAFEAAWTGSWTGAVPSGVAVDYADLAREAEALFEGARVTEGG